MISLPHGAGMVGTGIPYAPSAFTELAAGALPGDPPQNFAPRLEALQARQLPDCLPHLGGRRLPVLNSTHRGFVDTDLGGEPARGKPSLPQPFIQRRRDFRFGQGDFFQAHGERR